MSECSEDDQFCCAGCCAALRFLHWFCLLLKCRDLQRWVSHHRWIHQGSLLCAKDLLTFEACLQAYSIEACCIENLVCIELVILLFSLLFLGATARSISLMADRPVSCVSASKFLFQNWWTPLNSAFASTNEDMLSWSPSIPKLFEHVAVIAGPFVDMIPAILAPLIAKRLSRWADNVSEKAQAVATLLHVATHHYTLPSGAIVDDSRLSRHLKTLQDTSRPPDTPGFSWIFRLWSAGCGSAVCRRLDGFAAVAVGSLCPAWVQAAIGVVWNIVKPIQ